MHRHLPCRKFTLPRKIPSPNAHQHPAQSGLQKTGRIMSAPYQTQQDQTRLLSDLQPITQDQLRHQAWMTPHTSGLQSTNSPRIELGGSKGPTRFRPRRQATIQPIGWYGTKVSATSPAHAPPFDMTRPQRDRRIHLPHHRRCRKGQSQWTPSPLWPLTRRSRACCTPLWTTCLLFCGRGLWHSRYFAVSS